MSGLEGCVLILAIAGAVAMVRAAPLQGPAAPRIDRDSARIRRSAESAQRSFEAYRRNHLPIRAGDNGGPCDVRIGRYCYWRGDDADEAPKPDEAPDIRSRRNALIAQLDSAAAQLPGDRGSPDSSRAISPKHNASTMQCTLLRHVAARVLRGAQRSAGYAAHADKRFAAADSAFGVALASLDLPERCRWLDIGTLLDGPLAERFEHLPCDSRDSLTRRILQLGAPLYSVSTTDLLTEHLSRYTLARIAEHSATPDGEPWGDDERELVIRYGWPQWYSRGLPPIQMEARPLVVGHDAGMPYDFVPSDHAVDHDAHIGTDDWTLADRRARTGYAPAYARSLHDVPSQIARFRRGDSTLIVAAWDVRRDTTLIGRPLTASLAIAADGTPLVVERHDSSKTTGHLFAITAGDSGVVSLELLATADRRAARRREGFTGLDAHRVALSDLMLYSPSVNGSADFATARDNSLPSNELPLARAVGVYWEAYGLRTAGEPVHYTLSVQQVGVSWMRRTVERLHLADRTTGLRLQWDEVPEQHDGIAGRGVRIDLSRLRSGTYRLAVTADTRPATATSEREIVIR